MCIMDARLRFKRTWRGRTGLKILTERMRRLYRRATSITMSLKVAWPLFSNTRCTTPALREATVRASIQVTFALFGKQKRYDFLLFSTVSMSASYHHMKCNLFS